jgi:hypothetical protein
VLYATSTLPTLISIGDRVEIQSLRLSLAPMLGQQGTVTAIFDMPYGSCTVRLDNYVDQPDLFVYRIEAVRCTDQEFQARFDPRGYSYGE